MANPKLPGQHESSRHAVYGDYGTKAAESKRIVGELDHIPDPPATMNLGPEGKEEWVRIGRLLLQMRQLTDLDVPCMEGYIEAFQMALEAGKDVALCEPRLKLQVQKFILSANEQKYKWLSKMGLTTVNKGKYVATESNVPSAGLKLFAATKPR